MRGEDSLKLGIAELLFQIDAFIHAQTPVLFHIIDGIHFKVSDWCVATSCEKEYFYMKLICRLYAQTVLRTVGSSTDRFVLEATVCGRRG
jgi:hypothetical protein